jgi:hypothetical protein
VLADYRRILRAIYSPSAYFARVRDTVARLKSWPPHGEAQDAPARWSLLGQSDRDWGKFSRLALRALRAGPMTSIQLVLLLIWVVRTDSRRLHLAAVLAAFYCHLGPFARFAAAAVSGEISAIDRGRWRAPPVATPLPAETMRPLPSIAPPPARAIEARSDAAP